MSIIYNPSSIPLRIPFSHWRNYNFIKPIRIIGSNTKLTDYQVKIELNSTNFPFEKCRADGADLRFVDIDGRSLDYWLESWSKSNKTATLWSKIPEILDSADKLIWLIYGNSSASSASNGTNTFEFFDDFDNSGSIEPKQTTKDTVYDTSDYAMCPFVIKLHNKTLFAVFNEGDAHGCPNNHDVKWINSTNNGSTWSSPTTITTHPDASTDARNVGVLEFNDSGTWTILVYYNIQTATIGDTVCKKSTDGGANWSSEISITTNNDRYCWGGSIEMSNGNLLIGTYAYSPGTGCYAQISSDDGDNWTEYIISATSGMSEVSFIEKTTNGHILAIIRNYVDGKTYSSSSTDYGQTWSTPANMSLTASDSPITLLRLNDGNMLMSWEKTDADFRVAISKDEGATWDVDGSYSVYYDASMPANAGYVSSVEISNNQLYSLFYVQHAADHADIYGNDVNISVEVKWLVDRGDWTMSNSELILDSVDTIRNPVLRPKPLIWRSRIHFVNTTDYMMFGMCEELADEWGSLPDGDSIFYQALITAKDYPTSYNDGILTQNTTHEGSSGYHIYGIKWKIDIIKYFLDDSLIETFTTNVPDEPIWTKFDHRTGTHKIDWIMIAKYASPEPQVIVL